MERELSTVELVLNEAVLERTWTYISVAGAAFALNALIKFMIWFRIAGDAFNKYYIVELTQIIFLMAFIMAAYNKMLILKSQRDDGVEIWKRMFKSR
ncbi:MAG: hypothetical protein WC568_02005 [Candidatus Methanoperedens sp.]